MVGVLIMKKLLLGIMGSVGVIGVVGIAMNAKMGDELEPVDISMTDAEKADKIVRTKDGKAVRIVGSLVYDKDATPSATPVGNTVEASTVPENALCNLTIEAAETSMGTLYLGERGSRKIPNLPKMSAFFGKASWPVKIDNSLDKGKWLWTVLMKGEDCLTAADMDIDYIGSSMGEFRNMTLVIKRRMLRTEGVCDFGDGKVKCSVPFGDPRAVAGKRVYVPHGWAGLDHGLNYLGMTNDVLEDRNPKVIEAEPVIIE